ncbi:MAG TPA: hypothetical protein VGR28_00260 [Candidatus Thermoplasmatota archaeon]|jgi:hypothetical protein|nr:hypothetical protein [Candidatus Thermoplasmatota archaeon]
MRAGLLALLLLATLVAASGATQASFVYVGACSTYCAEARVDVTPAETRVLSCAPVAGCHTVAAPAGAAVPDLGPLECPFLHPGPVFLVICHDL